MIEKVRLKDLSSVKKTFIYQVEDGDDIKSLADRFHTTQSVIIQANCLSEELKVGEYIIIERVDGEKYIVKPNDNLQKIANNNMDLAREIARKNKVSEVYVGQKIYI